MEQSERITKANEIISYYQTLEGMSEGSLRRITRAYDVFMKNPSVWDLKRFVGVCEDTEAGFILRRDEMKHISQAQAITSGKWGIK